MNLLNMFFLHAHHLNFFTLQYNGCLWKGGKLRLEKAKEHYLVRMKREWSEDAQLAKNAPIHDVDAPESMPSEKSKKLLTLDKPNLRIFFPKLNKVDLFSLSQTRKFVCCAPMHARYVFLFFHFSRVGKD